MFTNKNHVGQMVALKLAYVSVLALTDLPEVRDKIWTSENYEKICLNKQKTFLSLAFGQVRTNIKARLYV